MSKVIFKFRDVEISERDGRYFIKYDVGTIAPVMREDEISMQEAQTAIASKEDLNNVMIELQKRLTREGVNAYVSNLKLI
ncbi:hypothetical protein DLD99_16500 [Pseudomonas kribbensis]|uniref:Uncharacterized protein n=1 Tax=Pseudomonas kribbensis TaxID=1628086 RepID=A0A345RRT9_9PSED|nr:hypothetical protein [Pseudomonas kribbensis]AXI62005.1 hypothetical protein DLD99_16500 [Pseudomonas kribbensis]